MAKKRTQEKKKYVKGQNLHPVKARSKIVQPTRAWKKGKNKVSEGDPRLLETVLLEGNPDRSSCRQD